MIKRIMTFDDMKLMIFIKLMAMKKIYNFVISI